MSDDSITHFENPETGDKISSSGIVHGARYGLDVEGSDEEDVLIIRGERYVRVTDDNSDDE